jgi:hypothetical protein
VIAETAADVRAAIAATTEATAATAAAVLMAHPKSTWISS